MKTNILTKALLFAGCALALSACDENTWNDHLDGFKEANDANVPEVVKALEYTLTDADYATIAGLSANKSIASAAGVSSQLAALANNRYFTPEIPASDYIPAFLATANSFFVLDNGSSVKMTYNVGNGLPQAALDAPSATSYLLTEDDYKEVWGSDENYISAFAPSVPAGRNIPKILRNALPDAEEGEYTIVTYSVSEQEPVFADVSGSEFELSSTIADAERGADIAINGIITGVTTNGYVVTDASGSIFVYVGNSFELDSHPVGSQVTIAGSVSSYNYGLQISGSSMEETIVGSQEVTYPAPIVYTGAELDTEVADRVADGSNYLASYVEVKGTVKISGNNINIIIPGAETAQASAYYATDAVKGQLTDGAEVDIHGWWIAIAGKRYCSIVMTSVDATPATASAPVAPTAAAVQVPTVQKYALYRFDGTAWAVASEFAVVQPADYTAMGQTYGNITEPDLYLPTFLSTTFPYALEGDTKIVFFKLYKDGKTSNTCAYYHYTDGKWSLYNGAEVETAQFVKNGGKWLYDPNVTINLPSGRGQTFSAVYYQACVDWVFENICVPLGDDNIKSGKFYVTSYGNNEYYSGTSAYQNNVDLRAGSARAQYSAGWENYTDEQIVATMKNRFTHEVLPAVLSNLNSEATPIEGLDVIYTVNFAAYDGTTTTTYAVRYKVTAPATFEFIDCTWDNASE